MFIENQNTFITIYLLTCLLIFFEYFILKKRCIKYNMYIYIILNIKKFAFKKKKINNNIYTFF